MTTETNAMAVRPDVVPVSYVGLDYAGIRNSENWSAVLDSRESFSARSQYSFSVFGMGWLIGLLVSLGQQSLGLQSTRAHDDSPHLPVVDKGSFLTAFWPVEVDSGVKHLENHYRCEQFLVTTPAGRDIM